MSDQPLEPANLDELIKAQVGLIQNYIKQMDLTTMITNSAEGEPIRPQGSAGTFGTLGSAGGCFGSFGTLGSISKPQ